MFLHITSYQTQVKLFVESATLTRFNLTSDGKIAFNLTAHISIRNPNKRVGVKYKEIDALAFYDDAVLGSGRLGGYFQPKKNTTFVDVRFAGETEVGDTEKANQIFFRRD